VTFEVVELGPKLIYLNSAAFSLLRDIRRQESNPFGIVGESSGLFSSPRMRGALS